MEAAGSWDTGFIWPSSCMLSPGYSLTATLGEEEDGGFTHCGWSVPMCTAHSSSELWQPPCSAAQGTLFMAPQLLPVHPWVLHCSKHLPPAHPARRWCQGQEEREPWQPTRASSCALAESGTCGMEPGWGSPGCRHLLPCQQGPAAAIRKSPHMTALSLPGGG